MPLLEELLLFGDLATQVDLRSLLRGAEEIGRSFQYECVSS